MPPSSSTLLEILPSASEFLRTTKACHIDETRSVFPNLGCREIVDCSHCTASLIEQAIAATRQVNTFRRIPRHSSFHVKLQTAPAAFHHTQARQATTIQQTRSTTEHDTTATNRATSFALPGHTAQLLTLRHRSTHYHDETYDCVSYAVNRFLEPLTECGSVSDDKDRYYN